VNQTDLLKLAVESLDSLNVVYMLVGSLASSTYGDPRSTRDIDLVLDLPIEKVEAFCDQFKGDDFYCSREAIEKAARNQQPFNVIHTLTGLKLDFMPIRTDAWGEEQLVRRRRMVVDGVDTYVASPEDIILAKMWYFDLGESDKHLSDIAGVCKASNIDTEYVQRWADRLGYASIWKAIEARLEEGDKPHPTGP
jgi:hypothetical protein